MSGLEATLTGLFTTKDVLSPYESPSFATVATGVLAVAFALGSRFSFVTRNRALMRATELPHEFLDARDAELAALAAEQQAVGQEPENAPEVVASVPESDNGEPAVHLTQAETPPLLPEPRQPENPWSTG